MAVKVGQICIQGVDKVEDLKKHGIYPIGKDLNKIILNKTPLDYEFLVIDGSEDNLFIKAIQCLFEPSQPNWPNDYNDLNEAIIKEFTKDNQVPQVDKDNCVEMTFAWMSRIIERLPGRIIILGDNANQSINKPSKWDDIVKKNKSEKTKNKKSYDKHESTQRWICKRVVWLPQFEKFEVFQKKSKSIDYESLFKVKDKVDQTPKELMQSFYHSWVNNLTGNRNAELQLNFTNRESKKINIGFVSTHVGELKYRLCVLVKKDGFNSDIDNELNDFIFFPFRCQEKFLASNNEDWEYEFPSNHDHLKTILTNNKGNIRSEINKNDFCILIGFFLDKVYSIGRDQTEDVLFNYLGKEVDNYSSKVPCLLNNGADVNVEDAFLLSENPRGIRISLNYSRHDKLNREKMAKSLLENDKYYYWESLTGGASHFNLLNSVFSKQGEEVKVKKTELYFNLVENGLFRILIADERLASYFSNNNKIKEIFECSGIFVIENIEDIIKMSKSNFFESCSDESFKSIKADVIDRLFDVFIIHQGIIDKLKVESQEIEALVNIWKDEYFSFVVVTSGRGTPAEVPLNTRFIPFSVLESNLLTSFVSKFIVIKSTLKCLTRRG